ncbi:hypothetical protein CRYUN_Cryun03dG0057300 [Craigia yunnanensis]
MNLSSCDAPSSNCSGILYFILKGLRSCIKCFWQGHDSAFGLPKKRNSVSNRFNNNGSTHIEKPLPVCKATAPLLKTEGGHSDRSSSSRIPKFGKLKVFPEDHEPWRERILDPGSEIFLLWNRIFLFWCLVALFVDPLFFYLPSVINKDTTFCMDTDLNLGIIVTCFRTLADALYIFHRSIKFRTAYVSPTSRVFGKGELVTDPDTITMRYLNSDFFVDLPAALPFPQVLGASLYLLSIERYATCWKSECRKETSPIRCNPHYLDCGTLNDGGHQKWENSTVMFSKCDPYNDISFDYGIFEIALTKQVLSSDFLQKYFYCLWWGLQNLSTFMWETLFAILIAILGLVLFAHLIGNMQTYLVPTTHHCETGGVEAQATRHFVANQFRRLHSKKLQHTFRYHSYHWRTWGACFIQAAWRRRKKKMMARNLSMIESLSYPPDEQVADETEQEEEHTLASSNTSQVKQNLGVTILASRFAENTRRGAQKMKGVEMPKLQKPEQPDFSAEPDDE